MVTSQNGWPASSNKRTIGVELFKVAGVEFVGGVKAGDVAAVLGHVVTRFHHEVEKLVSSWCWGWAYRDVRAGSTLSNHASGTAIDVNAPAHPLGKRGTFAPRQRDRIRDILSDVDGVVRWGGNYNGRPDEMHFEINAGPAMVARVAARLRNRPGGDVKNLMIMHEKTNRATYVGNGVTRRYIKNATELADLQWWIARMGGDPTDYEVEDGHLAGVLGVEVKPA